MSDSATPSRPPLVGREPSYRCCSVGSRTRGAAMAPSSGSAARPASVRRDSRRRSAPWQRPGAHASCGAVVSRQTAHRRTGHGLRSSARSSGNGAARTSPRSSGPLRAGSRFSFRNFNRPEPRRRNSLQERPNPIGSSSLTRFEPFCSGPAAIGFLFWSSTMCTTPAAIRCCCWNSSHGNLPAGRPWSFLPVATARTRPA